MIALKIESKMSDDYEKHYCLPGYDVEVGEGATDMDIRVDKDNGRILVANVGKPGLMEFVAAVSVFAEGKR